MTSPRPTVFITGASSGIGAACVKVFAAAGWDVFAAARRQERLEALAGEVQAAHPGAKVTPLACDVDTGASVSAAFRHVEQAGGRLDALVNNAGFGVYGTVEDLPLERVRANMETNFFGAIRCTQAALPLLRAAAKASTRRWGAGIVMVSSFVGRRAVPGLSAYCASKFALEGLSEALRLELRADRILVSVVNPGVTQTEFFTVAEGERPRNYSAPELGMPAETVARVILSAARRPRRNVYLTLEGKAGLAAQWLSPRCVDWALTRVWNKRSR